MEGPPPTPTMANLHVAPLQTGVMTNTVTSLPQASSVIEVVPSRPGLDQSSDLIAEVLPPEGFTLVNLDLESLQFEPTAQQQLEEEGMGVGDELDDGVNLVVKGSWWWCKDCNVKQKFGVGQSIEDHLRTKHSVSTKTEDEEIMKNSQVQQCSRQEAKDGPSSDVISSVYTIPSNLGQGQDVETFIVIDGTTTVQVITKQTDDNTVLLTPVDNKPVVAPQDSSLSNSRPNSDSSGNSSSVMKTLSQMKPIPVLPALQLTDTSPSYVVTAPSSPHAEIPVKETTASKIGAPETSSSNVVSESPQPCTENATTKLPMSKSASDLDSGGSETESQTGKSSTQTHPVEDERPDTLQRKPALSTTGACGMVTRRRVGQKIEQTNKKSDLKQCSVHLTRLSVKEMHQVKSKPARGSPKLKPIILVQTAKSVKDTNKSISLKSQISSKKSAKNGPSLIHNSQHITHTKRDASNASPQSDLKNDKKLLFSGMKSRTSSGRKIKKPARYMTGSESEEDNGPQPDDQSQSSLPATTPTSTNTPQPKSPQSARKYPKKRRHSLAEGDREPEAQTSETVTVSKAGSKKVKVQNHSCQDCGRQFKSENKLEKHRKLYAGQTMKRCSVCDVALHNADLLNVHMFHTHLTKESTSCYTCGNVLGSKRNLLNHLLTHPHMEGQTVGNLIRDSCAVHECSICDEPIIIGEGRVDRHYLIHEKPVVCSCQKCGQSFRHKKELYSHLKTHGDHGEVLQTSSDQCDKKGVTTSDQQDDRSAESVTLTDQLDTPTVSLHPDEKVIAESVKQIMKFEEGTSQGSESPFTVTFLAGDTAGTETAGQQGSQTVKPVIFCELCKKKFRTKKLLYQHLKIHGAEVSDIADNGDDQPVCSEPEPEVQPVDLSAGVPFGIPCSLVKVECSEAEGFLRKSFTTTVEEQVIPSQIHYSCALCEREFESENKARRHISRFSQQQTILQCNLCSSRFHSLDLFNVHYAYIHQPAGAATCLTCKTDFNNKGDFLTHLGSSPLAHPLSHKMGYSTLIQDACGTVTCSVCQKSMWNYPMNIANHTRKHRSLSCPICQQGMPYKYALFIHLQVHANSRNLPGIGKLSEKERQQSEQIEKLHRLVFEVESSTFVESNEKFSCSFCDGEVLRTRKNIHQHLDLHARKLLHEVREGHYFCPDCGENITVSDQNVADHLSSHGHSQVSFVCIFCSQTFGVFDEFRDHESKKHWLNVYFEKSMCEVCGKEFASRQQFQKHIKLHEEKQGLFSCSHCKQTFRFESKLQKHMAKHKKGSYACQFCGKLYMTKISLDRHEQVVHIGIKDFKHKCKLCDAQFINATHLRDHVTNKHTCGASYRCTQCGMGFQYLSTYARHKRVVHGGDTPYVCQECGEKFPQKKLLQRHSIVHTGVNPFQCPACPKSFGLERTMKEHYDFCHQGIQKFVCPYCGNKFPRNRSLKRHMETCRMAGVPQVDSVPVYATKVPIEIHAAAVKQQNGGLVVIQQV